MGRSYRSGCGFSHESGCDRASNTLPDGARPTGLDLGYGFLPFRHALRDQPPTLEAVSGNKEAAEAMRHRPVENISASSLTVACQAGVVGTRGAPRRTYWWRCEASARKTSETPRKSASKFDRLTSSCVQSVAWSSQNIDARSSTLEANPLTPRDLFEGRVHFEIPTFQRPYVWSREEQWEPLWEDIVRVADSALAAETMATRDVAQHFLGAVVYGSRPAVSGDVVRHDVIDGQQRMTTLQVAIDAAHEVFATLGYDDEAEALEGLVLNSQSKFRGTRERFKLWPSQTDRAAFERAMDPTSHAIAELPSRILEAHAYFRGEVFNWVSGVSDLDGTPPPGTAAARAHALSGTLQDRLVVVAIDLSGHDDSQMIFETLNDRGTPLLKADLIKNWIFRRGEDVGADVDRWAGTYWAEFDGSWWREEIRQGRTQRSRIDIFLQYWLTMRTADDVRGDNIFRDFVSHAQSQTTTVDSAESLLRSLRADADTYRAFAQLDESSPEGRFYRRVIEAMELATTTPVFLWLLSPHHPTTPDERHRALEAVESWVIRRTLLQLTTKDVNKFMIVVLRALSSADGRDLGELIVELLSRQTATSRIWPSDADLNSALTDAKVYGNIRQSRLRVILGAVEQFKRASNPMHEDVPVPERLELEHVMPRAWRTHWDLEPRLNAEEAAARDRLVHTIGNLTLITRSLNGSLSNRPWTDASSVALSEGGAPGKGKRALLEQYSLLVLNKEIVHDHVLEWTEGDIRRRSKEVVTDIARIWPGPDESLQVEALADLHEPVEFTDDQGWGPAHIATISGRAGETLMTVLDALSSTPRRSWSGADFRERNLTSHPHSALGALTTMVRSQFARDRGPVFYEDRGGQWFWSVDDEFADEWNRQRALTRHVTAE
ncbi:DUF262 domain-containing protein [Pseudoclavibacter sp. Z016]|uniref:DUF262 domain-containing protein n=1 Tax=Pseudoclavibacter sp. Z016 TaxID=2080581 RepID=UPI000CE7DB37|nr:DUF262 domain-containing protein [Pseudoclavibacter sp. Z016]PPF77151.1 hypothetical protein C5B99_04075 [Pseudoclavibacter sp. Z016]